MRRRWASRYDMYWRNLYLTDCGTHPPTHKHRHVVRVACEDDSKEELHVRVYALSTTSPPPPPSTSAPTNAHGLVGRGYVRALDDNEVSQLEAAHADILLALPPCSEGRLASDIDNNKTAKEARHATG